MSERWIDFTPEPPKPPDTIPDGTYFAKILKVEEKISQYSCREYWHWTFSVEGVHPDFRLHYATVIADRDRRLAEFYKAVTGKKPKGKILITPADYIGVRVKVQVRRKVIVLRLVNEILSVKHA